MKPYLLFSVCLLMTACATRNDREALKELETRLTEEFSMPDFSTVRLMTLKKS